MKAFTKSYFLTIQEYLGHVFRRFVNFPEYKFAFDILHSTEDNFGKQT